MFYQIVAGRAVAAEQPEPGLQPLAAVAAALTPAQVEDLHRSFQAWGDAQLAPGPVVSARTWADATGKLAFVFAGGSANAGNPGNAARSRPAALTHFGLARELAAWLVLLAKWQPLAVVIAQAQRVWPADVLGGALPFATPIFLPAELVAQRPDNWEAVARALAVAAAPAATQTGTQTVAPTGAQPV